MIRICSNYDADLFLKHDVRRWHAIVIITPGAAVPEGILRNTVTTLQLSFHDIEYDHPQFPPPTSEHIRSIFEYARSKSPLIVCCESGISRAPAVGYLINCLKFKPDVAINCIDQHGHSPNRFIIQLGAEILSDRSVIEQFDKLEDDLTGW